MEIIKFRGLLNEVQSKSVWVYGYYYEDETGSYIKEPSKNKRFGTGYEVIKDTVSMFTGKRDKNGKEIWEGDIIEFDEIEWGGKDNKHLVSWDERDARWDFGGGTVSDMEWRKVIGNIFETPELLYNPF